MFFPTVVYFLGFWSNYFLFFLLLFNLRLFWQGELESLGKVKYSCNAMIVNQTTDSFYLQFINNFDLSFYSFQTIFTSNHPKLLSSLTFFLSLSLVYKQILILEGSLSTAGLRDGTNPARKSEHTNNGPRALSPRKPWNLDCPEKPRNTFKPGVLWW